MEKLYFFTGENIFALEAEILRWKTAFFEKHGQENFLEMQAKTTSLTELLDAVSVMPFIAEKRLVLIRSIPSIEKDDLEIFIDAIHPQTVVVIAEPKPDKRLGIVKQLLSAAEVQKFPILTPHELRAWSNTVLAFLGCTMSEKAWNRLVDIVGTDQWMLDTELRKIAAYAGNEIKESHVEEVAVPSGEQVIWKLTDLVGGGKTEEALTFLRSRIERGEDPYGLWSVLLNMVKNTVLVWSGLESGLRDEKSISSAFGMNFFAVRGLLPLAKSLQRNSIHSLVSFASDSDIALKNGGYHYSSDNQEVLIALIERLIVHCRSSQ